MASGISRVIVHVEELIPTPRRERGPAKQTSPSELALGEPCSGLGWGQFDSKGRP